MTNPLENLDSPSPVLTPEQIEQTYELLGLNDPKVREFYRDLESLNHQQQPQFELRTSHHSSLPQ